MQMKLIKSFYYAFCGILNCIKYETNFRIHIVAMISVIMFSKVYQNTPSERSLLVILISLVMVGELINTAIESIVDIVSPEKSKGAKLAKDAAAGAVLIFAFGAVLCAAFLFSDAAKWMENILPYIEENWLHLAIYIALSWFFIFKCGKKKDKQKG